MHNFNYELLFYLVLLVIAIVFAFKAQPRLSNGVKLSLFLLLSMSLSAVVRLTNFDSDIAVYAEAMQFKVFSFYYLREPVVWLGQRAAFSLFDSEVLVFMFFDFFVFLALYVAFSNYRLPFYAYFSFLCFFPFVLGMQNVYRQWVSAVFCLLAFSFVYRSYLNRYLAFLVAGLSHNVAGVFISAFFLLSKSKIEKLAGAFFLAVTPAIVFFAAGSKSAASTGQNLVVAYLGLLVLFTVFMVLSSRLKIRLYERPSYLVICIGIYVSLFAAIFLTSTGAERIAMYSLMLIYPHLVNFFEWHYKQRFILRILMTIGGFFPILIFGTRSFLV